MRSVNVTSHFVALVGIACLAVSASTTHASDTQADDPTIYQYSLAVASPAAQGALRGASFGLLGATPVSVDASLTRAERWTPAMTAMMQHHSSQTYRIWRFVGATASIVLVVYVVFALSVLRRQRRRAMGGPKC